jgi:hypothetical protein
MVQAVDVVKQIYMYDTVEMASKRGSLMGAGLGWVFFYPVLAMARLLTFLRRRDSFQMIRVVTVATLKHASKRMNLILYVIPFPQLV